MIFAKKSLGQNFLKDKNILKKITDLTEIKNRNIIEIGPGEGSLTEQILNKKPKSLLIIEKDNHLAANLKKKYLKNKIIRVYNDDILKVNVEKVIKKNSLIMGNLPYNISSQILVKFLKFRIWLPNFTDLVFMFQKELGEKIISKFPSSNYGRISILTNYRLKIKNKFYVSPNSFFPKPKVTSMVIHLKPIKNPITIKDISNLEKVTNILFSNNRNMINKNIQKLIKKDKSKKISFLDLKLRPSEIDPDTYYKITQLYES